MNVYQALDNNGGLIALVTDKTTARKLADSHQKDAVDAITANEMLAYYPANTQVTNAKGKALGTLGELANR